ncbi:hypothetical protein ABH945_007260, partial [Paraburkholderia sp. GAS333]
GFVRLRIGLTQSCFPQAFTNRLFCTFLHSLGQFETFTVDSQFVDNQTLSSACLTRK